MHDRQTGHGRRRMSRVGPTAILIVLLAALSLACDEFSVEPARPITLEPLPDWPSTFAVTEAATLEVQVIVSGTDTITGLGLDWDSSDDAILEVIRHEPAPGDNTLAGRLSAQRHATVTARAHGSVDIIIQTHQNGLLQAGPFRVPITVIPMNVGKVSGWRDVVTATDADVLEIAVTNSVEFPITGIGVSWRSSDASVLEVSAQRGSPDDSLAGRYRAETTARARGVAEVIVTVTRDGFEPTEYRDTVTVVPVRVEAPDSLGWRDTLSLTEEVTAEIAVFDAESTAITDLRVAWRSSDPQVLGVVRVEPDGPMERQDSLDAHRKAVLTARRSGTAEVIAVVDEDGFEPREHRTTVTVVPLTTDEPPDSLLPENMTLSDTVTVRLSLANNLDSVITGRAIDWQSGNEDIVQVIGLPSTDSALVIARGTGTASVTAVVDPAGFEPMSFSDNVLVTSLSIRILHDLAATERIIPNSDTVVFQAEVRDMDANLVTDRQITWLSGDGGVIEVLSLPGIDTNGEVRARARGTAQLRAIIGASGEFQRVEDTLDIRVMERWVSVSAGFDHTCGVTVDSVAYCWGSGASGSLGNGSTGDSERPVPVFAAAGTRFRSVSAGSDNACGDILQGVLECWGVGDEGRLGSGSELDQLTPIPVALGRTFESFSAGTTTCAVSDRSIAYCWGNNKFKQLGSSFSSSFPFDFCASVQCSLTPRAVRWNSRDSLLALAVDVGRTHACAIARNQDRTSPLQPLTEGTAVCWGTGALADVTLDTIYTLGDVVYESTVPLPVANGSAFVEIGTGSQHTCALAASRMLYCWGGNSRGQLGDESTTPRATPIPVAGNITFQTVTSGGSHTCGLESGGLAYCWGANDYGQLGIGSRDARSTPTPVTGFVFMSLSAGEFHTCGILASGAIYCWGRNTLKQLGTTEPSATCTVDAFATSCILVPARVSEPLN